jgi:hypothetical protein
MQLDGDHEYLPDRAAFLRAQWTRRLAAVEAELGRTEERLRQLLAAGDSEPARP